MEIDDFKNIEIQHKGIFDRLFSQDPPEISELTFTNLFIWRHKYHTVWLQRGDCLAIVLRPDREAPFGLQPVGPGNKVKALDFLVEQLKKMTSEAKVGRVSEDFVRVCVDHNHYDAFLDRDNSDYVYRSQDLIELSGRSYHSKKNHLNRFSKNNRFGYRKMDEKMIGGFLTMQEKWCQIRECMESPELLSEDYAIREALTHFDALDYRGGAVVIDSEIEAFALGEPLNSTAAVIHIEKGNPAIPGIYVAMNQLFCKNEWFGMEYVNREQDLGIEGLRKAKESYHPHHMVNKYTLIPRK